MKHKKKWPTNTITRASCAAAFLLFASHIIGTWASQQSPNQHILPAPIPLQTPSLVAHRGAMSECPENTLAAIERAIELGAYAVELDVRRTRDGQLVLMHDPTVDRTTDGTGLVSEKSLAEIKQLDAGTKFSPKYRGERVPTLSEALRTCHGRICVLLDLKEQGAGYETAVAQAVREHGDAERCIFGVRSPDQARRLRRLLPQVRQLAFLNRPDQIDAFAQAGVDAVRLWPQWLSDLEVVRRVHRLKLKLQLNAPDCRPQTLLPLLSYAPDWLLVDDVRSAARLLAELKANRLQLEKVAKLIEYAGGTRLAVWFSRPRSATFLNRDYKMIQLPKELHGQVRFMFDGGAGDRVVIKFRRPAVVFAAFEYNDTGAWSFLDRRPPTEFGWQLWRRAAYRGTSNATLGGKPHYASIYYCEFKAGEQLSGLPPWWLCLAVMPADEAANIPGFEPGRSGPRAVARPFSYEEWAVAERPLNVPDFKGQKQFTDWQGQMRREFKRRLVFRYDQKHRIVKWGQPIVRDTFVQQEYHVLLAGQRLFRFFRLEPKRVAASANKRRPRERRLPTIVCFMGHGKVAQILEQRDSYQHACASQFAERGYLVYAMENVGMEPGRDTHLELDRILRLYGYGWYSLLWAHQAMLLGYVFNDPAVDAERVGVTGVSTGGLLALTAAALDQRVAAASVQGIFGSMRISFIRDRRLHCTCGAIPGLLPDFDLPVLALLVAPRPLQISNATLDGFGPAEAKRRIKEIQPIYSKAGGQRIEFVSPAGRHEFNVAGAIEFIARTIGKP